MPLEIKIKCKTPGCPGFVYYKPDSVPVLKFSEISNENDKEIEIYLDCDNNPSHTNKYIFPVNTNKNE